MSVTRAQRRLLRMFNDIERSLDGAYAGVAARWGISDSAFDILYTLIAEGDGCTQRELCDRCFCNKQTVNSSVHRLVGQGLLSVTRHEGGRTSEVRLTPEGEEFARQVMAPVVSAELAFIRDIARGAGEEAVLSDYRSRIDRLVGMLGECGPGGAEATAATPGAAATSSPAPDGAPTAPTTGFAPTNQTSQTSTAPARRRGKKGSAR